MNAPASRMSKRLRFASNSLRYRRVWARYRHLTLIGRRLYIGNLDLVARTLEKPDLAGGAIVECGCWKGGMACGLLEIADGPRAFHFFDSFEGLPPAKAIDGQSAIDWQADTEADNYYDNNRADEEPFRKQVESVARSDQRLHIHKGWFDDTLSSFPDDQPIAVLRLDGDWYDSTMTCLTTLFDRVMPGGVVIIDDYLTWDGCTRAVHDFLSARKAPEGLRQSRFGGVHYIVKAPPERAALADTERATV